jgi:hypothetical protein
VNTALWVLLLSSRILLPFSSLKNILVI